MKFKSLVVLSLAVLILTWSASAFAEQEDPRPWSFEPTEPQVVDTIN